MPGEEPPLPVVTFPVSRRLAMAMVASRATATVAPPMAVLVTADPVTAALAMEVPVTVGQAEAFRPLGPVFFHRGVASGLGSVDPMQDGSIPTPPTATPMADSARPTAASSATAPRRWCRRMTTEPIRANVG